MNFEGEKYTLSFEFKDIKEFEKYARVFMEVINDRKNLAWMDE